MDDIECRAARYQSRRAPGNGGARRLMGNGNQLVRVALG